jgi:isopentenyl phosphate kinase
LNREVSDQLIAVKLGGSVITYKQKREAVNVRAIKSLAKSIVRAMRSKDGPKRIFLVHGGGSFGHYWATRFGIGKESHGVSAEGISRTRLSMIKLHSKVLQILCDSGLPCETVAASELVSSSFKEINEIGRRHVSTCFKLGLTPITFGDILLTKFGARVISGDRLAELIARTFDVRRVVFVTNVDGVYEGGDSKGKLIRVITKQSKFVSENQERDVTGGMSMKVSAGLSIAQNGTDVFFVNGKRVEQVVRALCGKPILGTHIPSVRVHS